MKRLVIAIPLVLVICAGVISANPGAPNFGPALYGDGEVWGTKGAAALPAPNGNNNQSFDKLFVIVNGAPGQLPVAEAAPRSPAYNGGRWFTPHGDVDGRRHGGSRPATGLNVLCRYPGPLRLGTPGNRTRFSRRRATSLFRMSAAARALVLRLEGRFSCERTAPRTRLGLRIGKSIIPQSTSVTRLPRC